MAEATQTLGSQLLGSSRGIVAVRERVQRLLRQSAGHRLPPILICGETGTGKGLLARMIHGLGPRRDGPFVDVNCAAIPETLLEAELFGFERGAFTDARRAKPGLFQTAHHGTIFLDEVGLLPETLQAKLLKVIEERVVRRLGSTQGEPVDVAILAATNEDLLSAVRARKFREDLYHRLAVLTVELPPLRERRDDIVPLAEHFLAQTSAEYGLTRKALAPEARAVLSSYEWPGNVRELANVIERTSLLAEGPVLTAAMLQLGDVAAPRAPRAAGGLGDALAKSTVADLEERLILQALAETSWNFSKTAARLGVSRNTLKARIKKYGLQPGGTAAAGAEAPAAKPAPALPSPAPAPPGRAGVQWDSRRLALLRVVPATPEDEPPAAEFSRALDLLIQKVEAFGGRVVEIGVSGLVAAFGLEPVEDAPRRAALAAMAVQKAALRGGGQVERLPMKAAIHAALVPVARVGTAASIDGDARRDVWSVLDALIAASEPGAIVLSRPAMALLARWFDIADTGTSEARGGPAYRLMGYRATPFDVGGYMGRFVGRESELDLLRARFEAVRAGQGQVVALVGDAGIGKSRLLFEFRQSLADQPVTHLQGHCLSYGSAIPYLPILDAVRTMCRLAESDTPEAIAEKVRMCLERVGTDPAQSAPYLLHLLGIKDGTDLLATLGPPVVRVRIFEVLHALFLTSSQREPLVLAIEDLHWVDQASEEYLASFVERIVGARILLVATYRPGYRPPWVGRSSVTQVALQPLAPQDSLTVVRVVFGSNEVAEPLEKLILAKAEGNPFFLEELARAAREQGPASATLTAPDTVQEVLLARIDRLPESYRHLLQSAAVIGKDFTFEILRAIAGCSDEAVLEGVRHLQSAEFIYEAGSIHQAEYTFKHALTHEVAYTSLPVEQRRALHGKILDSIEALCAGRPTGDIERLAYHAIRGQVWDRAVAHLRQAGAKAASRSAHREAVACFEQALESLGHLSRSRETTERAIDLRFDVRRSLLALGDPDRAQGLVREAAALAETLDDRHRFGWTCCYEAIHFWNAGDPNRAVEYGERGLALGTELGDIGLRAIAGFSLGWSFLALGQYRRAIALLTGVADLLDGDLMWERLGLGFLPSVGARTYSAFCHAELGNFSEAISSARHAVDTAERVTDYWSQTCAYYGLGTVLLRKRELDAAIPVLERGLELCRRFEIRSWITGLASALGYALALAGRKDEALPLLKEAVTQAAGVRTAFRQSLRLAWLSEAYMLSGRLDEAVQFARESLALSKKHTERGHEAYALRLLAELALLADSTDRATAEGHYTEAIAIAEELEMRPLMAQCHLELARLYGRFGDEGKAREHLKRAQDACREMGLESLIQR